MLINIEPSETVLETDAAVTVNPSQAPTNVEKHGDVAVVAGKKEYAIVGDALFASVNAEETPPWLSAIIGNVIGNALNAATSDMRTANANIIQAISEISLARNSYEEYINIDATVDSIIASRVAQLNARMESVEVKADATITTLQQSYVAKDSAAALVADQIQASLETPGTSLNGAITSLESVVANLDDSITANHSIVASKFDSISATLDDVSASVEQTSTAFAVNGPNGPEVGAKFKIQVKTNGKQPDGGVAPVIGGFELTNDGVTTSAGFDVDTFWLGKPGADGVYPFRVDSDTQTVFMDNAIIRDLSVNKLTGIGDDFLIDAVTGKIRARYLEVQQIDLTDYVKTDDISNFATKDGTYTGNLATSGGPNSNTRMTITNSSIKVWNNGVLRVQIGDLTA